MLKGKISCCCTMYCKSPIHIYEINKNQGTIIFKYCHLFRKKNLEFSLASIAYLNVNKLPVNQSNIV